MMAKPRIKLGKGKGVKIGDHDITKATEKKGGTDGEYPVFSFKYCDENRHTFWEIKDEQQRKELIRFFKKMESMSWVDVKRHNSFRWETFSPSDFKNLPSDIPPDANIIHLKASPRFVIWGFRYQHIFHIIWFDKDHKVKPKKQ